MGSPREVESGGGGGSGGFQKEENWKWLIFIILLVFSFVATAIFFYAQEDCLASVAPALLRTRTTLPTTPSPSLSSSSSSPSPVSSSTPTSRPSSSLESLSISSSNSTDEFHIRSALPARPRDRPATYTCLKEMDMEPRASRRGFMMLSKKYKFLMCVTAKVGSRSWVDYVRWIHMEKAMCNKYIHSVSFCPERTEEENKIDRRERGSHTSESKFGFYFWEELPLTERLKIANDPSYTRFAIHRHPWSRLESGFRSKFWIWCQSNATCLAELLQLPRFPEKFERTRNNTGYSELDAFVESVVEESPVFLNGHIRPQSLMCGRDCIPYDYELELQDTKSLDKLTKDLKLPMTFSQVVGTGIAWAPEQRALPTAKPETIFKAHGFYRVDSLRFNYTFDSVFEKYAAKKSSL